MWLDNQTLRALGVGFADSNNMPMGSDAELFITSPSGKLFSAHKAGVSETVKKEKFGSRDYIKRDGAALEMEFPYGMSCREELGSAMRNALDQASVIAKSVKGNLSCAATLPILKSHLRGAPEDVKAGGCQPDRSAYTGTSKSGFGYIDDNRYAGGHMHFGFWQHVPQHQYETLDQEVMHNFLDRLTVLLDWGVSIPFTAMLGKAFASGEAERRRFYGQAGSYRLQRWGYEYRVPSARILLSPALMTLVYGMSRSLMQSVMLRSGWAFGDELRADLPKKSEKIEKVIDALGFDFDRVRAIIDTHDYEAAQAEWTDGMVGTFWKVLARDSGRPYTAAVDLIINADKNGVHFDGKNFIQHWQPYGGGAGIAVCMDYGNSYNDWQANDSQKLTILPQLAVMDGLKKARSEWETYDSNADESLGDLEDDDEFYDDDYSLESCDCDECRESDGW